MCFSAASREVGDPPPAGAAPVGPRLLAADPRLLHVDRSRHRHDHRSLHRSQAETPGEWACRLQCRRPARLRSWHFVADLLTFHCRSPTSCGTTERGTASRRRCSRPRRAATCCSTSTSDINKLLTQKYRACHTHHHQPHNHITVRPASLCLFVSVVMYRYGNSALSFGH